MAQIATLEEVERAWSICDLADAHEALDIQNEFEEWIYNHPLQKVNNETS